MTIWELMITVLVVTAAVSALDEGVRTVFRLEVWDYRVTWRKFLRRHNILA